MPKRKNGFFSPLREVFPHLKVENVTGISGNCYRLNFSCNQTYRALLEGRFTPFKLQITQVDASDQINVLLEVLNQSKEREFLPAMTAFAIAYREASRPRLDLQLPTFSAVRALLHASGEVAGRMTNPPAIEVVPATPPPEEEQEELGGSGVMVGRDDDDWTLLAAEDAAEDGASHPASPGSK